MHKRLLTIFTILSLSTLLLFGCGSKQEEPAQVETTTEMVEVSEEVVPEAIEEPTPEPTEEPTPEATEEPMPEATEEPVPEPTEEPVPEPQVKYTYTDMTATMYATQTVNVRNLPSTDGEKIGSLSTNQEVTVIGQCNETSWYMFDYNGQTAFVSNSFLGAEKAEVAPPAQEVTQYGTGWNDMGDWFVYIHPSLEHPDLLVDGPFWEDKKAILRERYPGCNTAGPIGIKLKDGTSSAWLVSVGGTHSYDYPQALLDFIKVYQYKY